MLAMLLCCCIFTVCMKTKAYRLKLRSQSINRCVTPAQNGKVPCLTPNAKIWLRKASRLLSGDERLALQGVAMTKYATASESTPEHVKCHMAGNAVNYFNMAQGLIAMFAVLELKWFQAARQ